MAVPIGRKIMLDTNVFIDYLRLGLHADWVTGRAGRAIRFLSAVVLMELRLGADTLPRRRAV
jgi:predicted nucleic acid-binding protein